MAVLKLLRALCRRGLNNLALSRAHPLGERTRNTPISAGSKVL